VLVGRDVDALTATQKQCTNESHIVRADLTVPDEQKKVVDEAIAKYGRVDTLVRWLLPVMFCSSMAIVCADQQRGHCRAWYRVGLSDE
jgi:NAD(P)-dependent dehydrogenase (short-subunit alcohol dehydrogenase family)